MELPAPAVLSTTTVTPSGLRRASARSRATRSVGPPAEKGTTTVMVLSLAGKSWAVAPKAVAVASSAIFSMVFMKSPFAFQARGSNVAVEGCGYRAMIAGGLGRGIADIPVSCSGNTAPIGFALPIDRRRAYGVCTFIAPHGRVPGAAGIAGAGRLWWQ